VDTLQTELHQKLVQLLVKRRNERAMPQTELAKKCHVSQTVIARIETHQRRIDIVDFFLLARALDLDAVTVATKLAKISPTAQAQSPPAEARPRRRRARARST
jgi:transcriptional regulator with XRE-family HTH domain